VKKSRICGEAAPIKTAKESGKTIGSNHILRNRQFVFTPKIEYELVAERSEANPTCLQFPTWCNYMTKSEPILNGTDGALRAPK